MEDSKKILLTGGLGFIGSHTAVELQQEGFEVVIVDDLSNSRIEVLDGITQISGVQPIFEQIDLKNKDQVYTLFEKYTFIGAIHFAASKAVGESVQNPLKYYENNTVGLLNILSAFNIYKVDNFLFSSSCTVYGQADQLPITEEAPFKTAESPYGKTKQIGEQILEDYAKAYTKNVISLRYFNPIGAHPSSLIGELPNGVPDNLIPFVTQTAAGIREKLAVFGDDYETRDGTCIRDYIYVVDLAKAHVKGLQRLIQRENEKAYEVFNLGTGVGSTVLEVIKAFESSTGTKLNYFIAPRRTGDIIAAYADTILAKEKLGWTADTPLEVSVKSAWDWQQKIQ